MSQPTPWGHASRVPGRGWRGAVPPSTPRRSALRRACSPSGGLVPIVADRARLGGSATRPMPVPDAVHVRVRATDWRHNPVTTLKWAPEIYSGAHFNAPGRARTCDLWIRSPLLYPAELRAPEAAVFPAETWWKLTKRGSSSTSVARRER